MFDYITLLSMSLSLLYLEASIWFENWGIVGPGLETEGVVYPKSSTDRQD